MPALLRAVAVALAVLLGGLVAAPAGASASGCFPIAMDGRPRLHLAALPAGATLRLTFLGHASFLIETAGGVTAITDYNGYISTPLLPDIVTMNNAHSTHYAFAVDPGVRHVLRGWNPAGGEARHDVREGDLRVRNVTTSVHGRSGDQGNSNSIFIFEVEDLCVAHLGHLHQILTREQLGELGQIDVLLVPVDGTWTMSHAEMVEVIEQVGAPLVVPMHYFGSATLARFLETVEGRYEVAFGEAPTLTLSRTTLPSRRRVLVLPGE